MQNDMMRTYPRALILLNVLSAMRLKGTYNLASHDRIIAVESQVRPTDSRPRPLTSVIAQLG